MFRLKGSRRGSHPGSLQRYIADQEEFRNEYSEVTQTKSKKGLGLDNDLKKLIKKIETGNYGKPENWKELKDDLISLLSKI